MKTLEKPDKLTSHSSLLLTAGPDVQLVSVPRLLRSHGRVSPSPSHAHLPRPLSAGQAALLPRAAVLPVLLLPQLPPLPPATNLLSPELYKHKFPNKLNAWLPEIWSVFYWKIRGWSATRSIWAQVSRSPESIRFCKNLKIWAQIWAEPLNWVKSALSNKQAWVRPELRGLDGPKWSVRPDSVEKIFNISIFYYKQTQKYWSWCRCFASKPTLRLKVMDS